jgi:hypothetical protein
MSPITSASAEAQARVALHHQKVEFIRISENDTRLPLEDEVYEDRIPVIGS